MGSPRMCWGDGLPWAAMGPMPFCLPLRPGPTQRVGPPAWLGLAAPKPSAWPWESVSWGTERVWAVHLGRTQKLGNYGAVCTGEDNRVPG